MAALREDLQGASNVAARHFAAARAAKQPSLTPDVLRQYEQLPAVVRQQRRQQAEAFRQGEGALCDQAGVGATTTQAPAVEAAAPFTFSFAT